VRAPVLSAALLALASACSTPEATWEWVADTLRERYPDVATIETDELALWLEDGERPAPLLFDARSPEEFAVSHLSGARDASSTSETLSALAETPRDRPLVVYCSVGIRSAELAEELAERGFSDVRNLRGGIFAWANAGRPVVRGEERVDVVHPFDASWGRLLAPELRADGR
jgi:rhodanese-related sulfurtransferase